MKMGMRGRLLPVVFTVAALFSFPDARAAYWSLFNIEGEQSLTATYVTYATLTDMLTDQNRLGLFDPNSGGFGRNVVGSDSDGSTYWSLFNIEGEAGTSATYVTYATLTDMLTDQNRLGLFDPNSGGFGRNVVGSGSDGSTYWSLFNIEGEAGTSATYVTYATLTDMLTDQNRLGLFDPNSGGFGRNVVGSGADILSPVPVPVPEPGTAGLLVAALAALALWRRPPRATTNLVSAAC